MIKRILTFLPVSLVTCLLFAFTAFAATTNPATGDNIKMGLLVGVLLLSLAGIITFIVMSIKKNKR